MDIKVSEAIVQYRTSYMSDSQIINAIIPDIENKEAIVDRILSALDKGSDCIKYDKFPVEIASKIALIMEIMNRWSTRLRSNRIRSTNDVYKHLAHYGFRNQEHVIVMALNTSLEILYSKVVSVGTLSMSYANPREVFSDAIKERAYGIIMAHNHPSGDLTISNGDLSTTKRIEECGNMLGIKLIDHIILSEHGYISMKQKGLIGE